MTRVIHTGDTHLGYRQYHSPERRADFLDAFRRVIEDAIAEDVDAVVHAGDLFHDRSPSLLDVHGAIEALRELHDAEIPFLAIVGNHERTREGQWVDLFETLGLATRLGEEPVTIGDDAGSDVALYGLDFVPRSAREDLDYAFAAHDAEFAALVAHGLFTPFNPEWNSKEVLASANVDFDALLLGDDHQPDTARVEGTWVTYCGSTERASAAERDERGYNLVDFEAAGGNREPGAGVSIRRRGIETRPFVTIDVELAEGEGAERVRERVREEALEDAVVVVSIDGAGEDLQPARIEEFARERGALIARVRDRREIETEGAIDSVSFADPDAAVRERIRELGLSEAALAIDETVRSDVADSNVRERVRERVEELVEEPGAFEPGAPLEEDSEAADAVEGAKSEDGVEAGDETAADDGHEDGEPTDAAAKDDAATAAETSEPDAPPTSSDGEAATAEADGSGDEEPAAASPDHEAESPPSDVDDGAEPDEPATDTSDRSEASDDGAGGGDGQLSMEDYL